VEVKMKNESKKGLKSDIIISNYGS